jgi:hypothetical protein
MAERKLTNGELAELPGQTISDKWRIGGIIRPTISDKWRIGGITWPSILTYAGWSFSATRCTYKVTSMWSK